MNPAIAFAIGAVIITLVGVTLAAINDFFTGGNKQ